MAQPPAITVLGSINMDLVVRCSTLPVPGETLIAASSTEVCGGKGANQVVAAARAGGAVQMIGRVGDDAFSSRLLDNLRRESVGCGSVRITRDSPSGLAIVAVDATGENSIIVVPGANGRVSVADVHDASSTIRNSDVLLVQLEIPVESVIAAIRIARDAGVRVILDPAPAPVDASELLFDVDLICPNETEAAVLTGRSLNSIDESTAAARQLQQRGVGNVAITLGARGTLLFDGNSAELIPSPSVTVVDTTATGDAFAGALAVRWIETRSLRDAVRFANVAGAIAASRHGAQPGMALRAEIEAFPAE